MNDLRDPEYRRETFLRAWEFHLRYGTHPGCVYHLLPAIADDLGLDADGRAWLVWLNGNTQNPVVSLMLLRESGGSIEGWEHAVKFWNDHWSELEWDTDRRYQKGKFAEATQRFAFAVGTKPAEEWLFAASGGWPFLWKWANGLPFMGRLSAWSMIEYARILLGDVIPDADNLMLWDQAGSRSHRAGLAVVDGHEAAFWGWGETRGMVHRLEELGEELLAEMRKRLPTHPDVTRLTLESALCTYKSWHKPNRRYPNVYADMAYGRIMRAQEKHGFQFDLLWEAREEALPEWARLEDSPNDPGLVPDKQNHYLQTGEPVMLGHVWPEYWSGFDQAVKDGEFGVRNA